MASNIDVLRELTSNRLTQRDEAKQTTSGPVVSKTFQKMMEASAKKKEKDTFLADGGDKRIWDYEQQVSNIRSNKSYEILYPGGVDPIIARQRQRFLAANPDLDPKIDDAEVKVKDVSKPAGEAVQNIIRILSTPDNAEGGFDQRWAAEKTKQQARKQYNAIKGQLTPAQRKRYDLDTLEAAGLFRDGGQGIKSSAQRTLSDTIRTPGIKQVVEGLTMTASAGASWGHDALVAADKGLDMVGLGGEPSAKEFNGPKGWFSDALQKKGFGDQLQRDLVDEARAEYERSGETNVKILGFNTGTYDPEADKVIYDETDGGVTDRNVGLAAMQLGGLAGDVALDPTTYIAFGANKSAKAGLRALERNEAGDLANALVKGGYKSLDENQLSTIANVLAGTKDPLSKAVQRDGVDAVVAAQMDAMRRGAQQGIHVGGRTIIPTARKGSKVAASDKLADLVSSIPTSEIAKGDHVTNILGSVEAPSIIEHWDPSTRIMTIAPGNETVAVTRKGGPTMAGPGTYQIGDELMDGNAKVSRVFNDGSLELKMDNQLESIERPFDIIPRYKTKYDQGTLTGVKDVPAPPPVYDQGHLLVESNKATIDDAIEKVKQAPSSSGAGGFGPYVDGKLPTTPGVHVVKDADVGTIIGLRDDDGKLRGYLLATNDDLNPELNAISTFESISKEKALGAELLDAAEDAGLDVPALLGNSDFTKDGRKAALRFLEEKKLAGRIDTATAYMETKAGGLKPVRVHRTRGDRHMLPEGSVLVEPKRPTRQAVVGQEDTVAAHAANRGRTVGTVAGWDGDKMLLTPSAEMKGAFAVGDTIPGTYGKLESINPDGTWVITPDPTMFSDLPLTAETYLAGLSDNYADDAISKLNKPEDGFTLDAKGNQPEEGFSVAVDERFSKDIPLGDLKPEDVTEYLTEHADELAKPGMHFGAWVDDKNVVWLDVTEVLADKDAAIAAGVKRNQIGVYDIATKETIPTGGTGAVLDDAASTVPEQIPGQQGLDIVDPPPPAGPPIGEGPLPDDPAFPPRATVLEDYARVKESKAPKVTTETPDDQLKLFDMGIVSTRDLSPGDRVRGLHGVVKSNDGRRIIVAEMDDTAQLVIRGDEVMRLDAKDLDKGDILFDSGMEVVSRDKDGLVRLKGAPPAGITRMTEQQILGGLPNSTSLVDKLPGQGAIGGFRDAFKPRASVGAAARRGEVGSGARAGLYHIQAAERAQLGNSLNDLNLRMHSIERRIRKGLGNKQGIQVVTDAFDVAAGEGSKAAEVAEVIRQQAKDELDPKKAANLRGAADALDTLSDVRQEIADIEAKIAGRAKAGDSQFQQLGFTDAPGADASTAGAVDQMPLVASKNAKKLLALNPDLRTALDLDVQLEHLSQGFDFSSRSGRTVLRIEDPGVAAGLAEKGSFIEIDLSRSAREVNAQVADALNESTRRALGLKEGDTFRLFEENPLTAYSYRNRTAQTVAIEQDMIARGVEEGIVHRAVIPKASDSAGVAAHEAWKKRLPEGLVPVQGWNTPGEVVYAHPTVAKEMSKVRAVLRNDTELKAFGKIVDKASALWVRQVLSPITKGLGQQMRNLQSNIVNATFGGLTLSGQREAIRLQTGALRQAGKLMRTEGLTFDNALLKLGLEEGSRDATLLRYLREDDILNTGLYRSLDWGDTTELSDTLLGSRKAKLAKEWLNPLSSRNVLFSPGRAVNTAIEDNGRMALYISVFDKTGDRAAAREAVATYLFDYADLTTFESHVLKRANAFYTFMRKNTALQIKVFADRPALPLTVLKAKGALSDDNKENLLLPGEKDDRGLFQAGGALQSIIGGKGVVGIDDPVTAAIRTVDPFIQAAYYTLDAASGGKLTQNLPPSERPTGQSVAKDFIGLTAGAPAEFLTTWAEVALQKDLRNDRELTESDTWYKLTSALLPVWQQGDQLKDMATGDRALRTNLLRMLAGITAYRRDDDKSAISISYAMLNELDETIKLLQAEGVVVPTLSDLQDAGLVPTAAEVGAPRTKLPLTPEERRAAAREKIGLK